MTERFFVTGALGCIGAWVVRSLVQQQAPTTVFDLAHNPHRLQLIMSPKELEQVNFIGGDITDYEALLAALGDSGATHVIHLAALQVPFCRADPRRGASVNVVGTVNLFEAARKLGLGRLVYASSVAVFGQADEYPHAPLGDDAPPHPQNLYGVYKLANEGTARIYWQENGIASLGLRPYTVYGPGRDQGMTSGPTKAMLAAAAGQPYRIPFGGRGAYHYAEDAARVFIQAARAPFSGAEVYNLRGSAVHVREIVDAIAAVEPSSRGQVTFADQPLPLPEDVDDTRLRQTIGELPDTPLADGVAQTIAVFRRALASGQIVPETALS